MTAQSGNRLNSAAIGERFRVLDAFAGAGGLSLGFQLAGCSIVGAIERDSWAAETFATNHPNAKTLISNIEDLPDEEISRAFADHRPNVLVGGPPCQGYSVCRRGAGDPSDPRNSLFEEFVRIGGLLSPELMVLENVPNLVKARTADGEFVIDIICKELQLLGYCVDYRILEAVEFGVPQIRKRLFVVASKSTIGSAFPFPTHALSSAGDLFDSRVVTPTLWEAISDLPELKAGQGSDEMDYSCPSQNDYQATLRQGSPKVFNHTAMKHSKRMVERFASMRCGDSGIDVPQHLRPFARNGNGVISEKVYDQNNRRMHPDRPCHTIPAAFYANFVHPFAHRNFTPREGARLQSFPDWYRFKGKPTVVSQKLLAREERWDEKYLCQYNQIGNAVPPLLAKALASHLISQIDEGANVGVRSWAEFDPKGRPRAEVYRPYEQEIPAGNPSQV